MVITFKDNIHFSESSMRVSPFPSFLSIAKALLSVIALHAKVIFMDKTRSWIRY